MAEQRYYSRMKKRMKYPIENLPLPIHGTLLTPEKRAAAIRAAVAAIKANGPPASGAYARIRITEAPNKR
jgi:hypothetical protein